MAYGGRCNEELRINDATNSEYTSTCVWAKQRENTSTNSHKRTALSGGVLLPLPRSNYGDAAGDAARNLTVEWLVYMAVFFVRRKIGWFYESKRGRMDMKDDPRSGRPTASTDCNHTRRAVSRTMTRSCRVTEHYSIASVLTFRGCLATSSRELSSISKPCRSCFVNERDVV